MRWLRRVPCKLMLATILIGLAVGEWYPFSSFPMYSRFAPQAWYVFVTDGSDQVVPTQPYFGVSAMPLRRMFETRALALRAAGASVQEAETQAAVDLLRYLRAEARPQSGVGAPSGLRLWRT